MFEGALLSVDSLLLLELFERYFLFDSLVALQEVTRANEFLQVVGGYAVVKRQSLNLGFANNRFGSHFQNAFRLLCLVVDFGHSFCVRLEFPRLRQLFAVMSM